MAAQASSTRYLLRVVTTVLVVVISVTIVPKSSRSDSKCRVARAEDCPAVSSPYEGREPAPNVSDGDCGGVNMSSIFTGINFQMNQRQDSEFASFQNCT